MGNYVAGKIIRLKEPHLWASQLHYELDFKAKPKTFHHRLRAATTGGTGIQKWKNLMMENLKTIGGLNPPLISWLQLPRFYTLHLKT